MDNVQYSVTDPPRLCVRSGRLVDPLAVDPADIRIDDIAHALSHVCRFAGHTSQFYSVGQHSVLVAREVGTLAALLHDASEYLLTDLPRPLKRRPEFAFYREAEAALQAKILRRFGVIEEPAEAAWIASVDRRMLRTEQRDLMPPPAPGERRDDVEPFAYRIAPWTPGEAVSAFLAMFGELGGWK